MMHETFDPDNIKQRDMDKLADEISNAMEVRESIIIIPEDFKEKDRREYEEAKRLIEELIRKLRAGKVSVFKDADEWNPIG